MSHNKMEWLLWWIEGTHFFSERQIKGQLHVCKGEQSLCLIACPGEAV